MSLDWDLSKIANYKELCYIDCEGREDKGKAMIAPLTEAIIFMCLATGMEGITEKNLGEFCIRAYMLQKLEGPWMKRSVDGGEMERYALDITNFRNHMGLTVNVAQEGKPWFNKKLRRMATDHLTRVARQKKEDTA